jgi:hypothetical protein
LQFDLVVNNGGGGATSYRLDSCGIHGLFQKVKEQHGSNVLYEMDNYGMFAKMLFDLQSPFSANYGKFNILTGTRNDLVASVNVAATATAYTFPATQINSGELIGESIANNGATTTRTYCVNLISILGALCPRNYLPLHFMTSAPLMLNVTLVDSLVKFLGQTLAGGTITISNIQFVAQFIELSDTAMAQLLGALPGNHIEFPITSYKNFIYTSSTLTAGATLSIPIPAKYASLKSYIVCQRASTGAATFFPFSSVANSVASYQFKIGPTTIPSTAPTKYPEMFAEVLKCFGSISDLKYTPNIDFLSYTLNTNTALTYTAATDTKLNNTQSGSFYIGIDLEGFPDAPKNEVFAGYNSTTDDTYLYITYSSAAAPPNTAPRFDIYAAFDAIIVCENGISYIRV